MRRSLSRSSHARWGQIEVMAAALAFAASVPTTKTLLADVSPLALSGVLYLSAGVLCAVLVGLARWTAPAGESNRLRGTEWLWLGGATLAGAVLLSLPAEGASTPSRWTGIGLVVGVVSFGLSIVLYVRGLRRLGVLQTGMLFALAPGFAAILSWAFLREPIAALGLAALLVMTAGALLLLLDRHEHTHEHEALEHTHEHTHDDHHRHDHDLEHLSQKPHAHRHRHEPLRHAHGHLHDVHHRHRH